jgi:hypothetical protein
MGKSGKRNGNRSQVTIPSSAAEALRPKKLTVPKVSSRTPRIALEDGFPKGKFELLGGTWEDMLGEVAPDEVEATSDRLIYGWLKREQIDFEYGHIIVGGQVDAYAFVEFFLPYEIPQICIRVLSYYWDKKSPLDFKSESERAALEYMGYRVEDVWDYDVNTYNKVEDKMREILYGRPHNQGSGPEGLLPMELRFYELDPGVCPYCGDSACHKCRLEGVH